ncbi:MAG: substrate-binding domain-containing protein [Dehalococcoidia bacterium]|nr:substrate-binding domain-containing protein [Dehalococcoidia bacterium]
MKRTRVPATIEVSLPSTATSPVYSQITESLRQMVATGRLHVGNRLPTVRQLAESLSVSPGTVAKAYRRLEEDGVIQSRRGGGTVVAGRATDPRLQSIRQTRLLNMMSNAILEALSQGYVPEEIEAAFSVHLDRWREEQKEAGCPARASSARTEAGKCLSIVASHDLALNMLVSRLRHKNPEMKVRVTYAGSLAGLIALQEGRADLAGIHLLDAETGEYNYPYVKHLLPGRQVAIVHLACRIQGLMFAAGNPKRIKGIEDLRRPDITLVNRQKGSGTRVLLDQGLRKLGIAPPEVKGYAHEVDTHLAVARNIAQGKADVGLGIEPAARACHIDFLPLIKERYDLVIPMENYQTKKLKQVLEIIASKDFQKAVTEAGGYDTSETGATTVIGGQN